MLALGDHRAEQAGRRCHVFPEAVRAHILSLKRLHPPIHYREIVRILRHKFGYRTNHHTVKRFLDDHPLTLQLELEFEPPRFHTFEDAYYARWTVVRMHTEGWNNKSIAACLQLSRSHVYQILTAFQQEGFEGLEDDRTRPPDHPDNQLTLPFLEEVLELQQEYPRAGRFRLRGLLEKKHPDQEPPSEKTVGRAMAHNRQEHDAPGPWRSQRDDAAADQTVKEGPFQPQHAHQFWFIDFRYLGQREGGWVYSLLVVEGYSRQILAGLACTHRDLMEVLQLLYAALSEYGAPERIVSDNEGVFHAHEYLALLKTLEIEPAHIAQGRPWQNFIEAQFKIQLRLADFKFENAQTVAEVQHLHNEFIETFNTTSHGAHQERSDGRKTPVEVLAWTRGRAVDLEPWRRWFQELCCTRTVNRHGFVRLQHFLIYAEPGLAHRRVAIWIYEEDLRIEYQQTLLAQYHCRYARRDQRLREVSSPTLYATPFRSPQLELFELTEEQWVKVSHCLARSCQKQERSPAQQLRLFELSVVSLVGILVRMG
jgi:transposase InsO family protein